MTKYIEETEVYKLVEPRGVAHIHCTDIDALPRADVISKSELSGIFNELQTFADNSAHAYFICRKIEELRRKYVGEKGDS